MAIPLVTMLGLFADVAYNAITNAINLDRAPSLIQNTSLPMAYFMSTLQAERRAALVYQSAPTAANKTAFQQAEDATQSTDTSGNGARGIGYLEAALNSPATKQAANPAETAAITRLLTAITGSPLTNLRTAVSANAVPAISGFASYTQILELFPVVFQAQANSLTDASAAVQGLGLIETINAREDMLEQDALLAGALAGGSMSPAERVAFNDAAGREHDDTQLFTAMLSPAEKTAYLTEFNHGAAQVYQNERTQVQQAIEAGSPLSALESTGLSATSWRIVSGAVATANFNGGLATAAAELDADRVLANNGRTQVYITGAIGLLGLILSLILTSLLARSINRRLTTLRRQAMALAEEHLPSVVSRLRRGEQVDVDAEAAPLRIGKDEIGQVGQAFDAVRQTAISSAVEEAKLRQGVNDVFRNLARRNQSLLQRQLSSLDQMERKATDPEVLEDLFKLDHLTTRMRRHAEGLIILSGAPPGRGWSAPVNLVDVMRGAVSEVEDYARVQVATQSKAALSGSAVADLIHLLAELIENATSLSPPFTQVRVTGEPVTNGFAIEIEDRGLGMTAERLAELNERLTHPPDVNPANTEQLGLFVVAKLAQRHGIQVMLRPSPYGGTTAVALIPRRLVVEDGPAAITSGENPMLQASAPPPSLPSFTPSGSFPVADTAGPGGTGPGGPGFGDNPFGDTVVGGPVAGGPVVNGTVVPGGPVRPAAPVSPAGANGSDLPSRTSSSGSRNSPGWSLASREPANGSAGRGNGSPAFPGNQPGGSDLPGRAGLPSRSSLSGSRNAPGRNPANGGPANGTADFGNAPGRRDDRPGDSDLGSRMGAASAGLPGRNAPGGNPAKGDAPGYPGDRPDGTELPRRNAPGGRPANGVPAGGNGAGQPGSQPSGSDQPSRPGQPASNGLTARNGLPSRPALPGGNVPGNGTGPGAPGRTSDAGYVSGPGSRGGAGFPGDSGDRYPPANGNGRPGVPYPGPAQGDALTAGVAGYDDAPGGPGLLAPGGSLPVGRPLPPGGRDASGSGDGDYPADGQRSHQQPSHQQPSDQQRPDEQRRGRAIPITGGRATRDESPAVGGDYPGAQSADYPSPAAYPGDAYPGDGHQSGSYPRSGGPAGPPADLPPLAQPPAPGLGSRAPFAPQGGGYPVADVPVVTGVPVSRDAAPPFDVFAPVSRPEAPAGSPPARAAGPESGKGSYQGPGYGNIEENGAGNGSEGTPGGDGSGLPRRVRQASLAPQLRNSTLAGPGSDPGTTEDQEAGVPKASAASLNDMRNTLSAMQRGWQQGRSQPVHRDTEGN